MINYHIGAAGWSYKDWVGSFYPKSQATDFLTFYSNYFNCVEVNVTYYSYINTEIVSGWVNKVSEVDDFLFILKIHQDFTHKRKYSKENLTDMLNNLTILDKAERLGGMLVQFPYSFSYSIKALNYIKTLREQFGQFNFFLELRHKSWAHKDMFELFRKLNISFSVIDQPMIGQSISFEPVITNDILYVRLHGRNEEAWVHSIENFHKTQTSDEKSARYDYLYSPSELLELSLQIKENEKQLKDIYVIANNHPGGHAVANSFELIHYLEGKELIHIPKTTLRTYPRLTKYV